MQLLGELAGAECQRGLLQVVKCERDQNILYAYLKLSRNEREIFIDLL